MMVFDLEMVRRHLWTYFNRYDPEYVREHPGGCLRLLKKRGQLVEFTARILPESKYDN